MGTIGEQLIGRIEAIERQITDFALAGPAVDNSTALNNLRDALGQVQSKIQQIEELMPAGSGTSDGPRNTQFMSPKELLPVISFFGRKSPWVDMF